MSNLHDVPATRHEVSPADPDTVKVPGALVAAARDLLARTAELPASRRELFEVLSEYRAAVHAFAVASDRA
jgi:hypothetical protein